MNDFYILQPASQLPVHITVKEFKILETNLKYENIITKSKLGFYILFNSQGHIGTGPQKCHLWGLNPEETAYD